MLLSEVNLGPDPASVKVEGEQDCILHYVCLIHWFSSSSCILLSL